MTLRAIIAVALVAVAAALTTAWSLDSRVEPATDGTGLPRIGPAAAFSLPDERGGQVSLADHKGKVVLVNFMFTRCYDICPVLTGKLAMIQEELAADFAEEVHFVSITVDPDYDRPEVLREFAENLDYDAEGWSFLTGTEAEVKKVANAYGVLMAKQSEGLVNHSLLTTVVDRDGVMRVQYLGERFDHMELFADLRKLIDGTRRPL